MTQAPQFDALVTDPVFPVTFRAFSEGIYGHGVIGIGGLEVTAGAASFDVDVATGEVQYNGSRFTHGAVSTLTLNQPDAEPRWDVVYFDTATESAGVKTGTPSTTPEPQDIGADEVLLAYIEIDPDAPDVSDADIRNWRARAQPAMNVPLDHADVDGDTVHDGLSWLQANMVQTPHDNADHDPNFSVQGHDHSGETLGETEALARINALAAELGQLASALDADGYNVTGIGNLTANAASVATAPVNSTDVARQAEIDDLASTVEIETRQVATRSDLPDPTGLSSPMMAYIDEENRYAGTFGSGGNFTQWRDMADRHPIYRDMADAAAYHWRMDEGAGTTITCEVTGETGTINGATWLPDNNLIGGYALEFDVGDWVEFTLDSTAFGGEEQMWVSVAFQDYEPNNRGILASVVDTANSDRWNLETGSWDANGSIGWWMAGDNNITSGAGSVQANTYYHTIGIHDFPNDHREIMLNDQSMNTTTAAGAVPGGEPTTFKIGRRGSGSRELVGRVGEVMIGFTELDVHDKRRLYERQPFSG